MKFSRQYNSQKLENAPTCKLTIDQSGKLLESAQRSFGLQSDSHVIQKLQKNIKKFEQFRINYHEYHKFKRRLQREIKEEDAQKEEELAKLEQQKDTMDQAEYQRKVRAASWQGIQREQSDLRFTLDFV